MAAEKQGKQMAFLIKEKPEMTTIPVAIDIGGSGTKVVYWLNGKVRCLWMEPQVATINPNRISRFKLGQGAPEDSVYLRIGKEYSAVGALGRIQEGDAGLKLPKRERAVEKILAALGVIWERIGITSHAMEVELMLLLPLNEYWKDTQELLRELRDSASEFMFRDHELSIHLDNVNIFPEGAGIFLARGLELGLAIRNEVITVIMCGHRNLSVLTFDRGNAPVETNSTSKGPGFLRFLEQCAAEITELQPDDPTLLNAILEGESELIVPGRTEAYHLPSIRNYAWGFYLKEVKEFLLKQLKPGGDEIIMAGGAATSIREELSTFFEERNLVKRVSWGEELQAEIQDVLPRDESQLDEIAARRLCDVYGAFKYLISQMDIRTTAVAS